MNGGRAASPDRFTRPGPSPPAAGAGSRGPGTRPGPSLPRQRQAPQGGPRQDYLDAFTEDDDVFAARPPRRTPAPAPSADPNASVTDWGAAGGGRLGADAGPGVDGGDDDALPTGEPAPAKGGKGRTFTGIAAAAVTTVLAVVVAGQVADGADGGGGTRSQSAAARPATPATPRPATTNGRHPPRPRGRDAP